MSHICHDSVRHNSTAPHLRNKLKVLWLCDIVWPEIVCWIRISSTDVGKASSRQSIDQGLMHLGLDWTSKVSNRKYLALHTPHTPHMPLWMEYDGTKIYHSHTKIHHAACNIPNTYQHYWPLSSEESHHLGDLTDNDLCHIQKQTAYWNALKSMIGFWGRHQIHRYETNESTTSCGDFGSFCSRVVETVTMGGAYSCCCAQPLSSWELCLWQCILSVTIRTRAGYGWVLTFATFSPHTLQIEAIQLLNNVKCRHGTFEELCCSSNSTKQQALPQEPKSLFAQSGSWKRKCHVNQRICRKCTILLALQALEAVCTRREMGWCRSDH